MPQGAHDHRQPSKPETSIPPWPAEIIAVSASMIKVKHGQLLSIVAPPVVPTNHDADVD